MRSVGFLSIPFPLGKPRVSARAMKVNWIFQQLGSSTEPTSNLFR
jgi:hypothetical protein